MISLNTNVSDLILQRTLLESTSGLNEALQRMSTGLKVNHAKDNAAGYSIIEDLNTRISSMLQVQNNTEDGISLLATAQGGLEEIQGLLVRLRDLTMQASNDTYDMKSRASMQAEADAILEEITRIRKSINYDGMNLYETQNTGMISRLAQSAVVNGTSAQSQISLFSVGEGAEVNSSSVTPSQPSPSREGVNVTSLSSQASTFSTGEGVNVTSTPSKASTFSANDGISLMSLDDGVAVASDVIEGGTSGSTTVAKLQTVTINIDGTLYEVTNRSTQGDFSWNKSGDTITFNGANFTIRGESGKSHNVLLNSNDTYFYGAELDDIVDIKAHHSRAYTYAGEDTVTIRTYGIYAETGDDNDIVYHGETVYSALNLCLI